MKLFKRLTAMVLAWVMIVTMMSGGMSSLASVVHSKENVTVRITVPETIYLTPGAKTFQYYLAGTSDSSSPSSTKATSGEFSFTCSKSTKSINVSVDGASSCTISPTEGLGTQLNGTMTGGSMASASASGVLTWTFTYVIEHTHNGVTTDETYTSKAYTYVYAPFLGQTGCMHSFTYIPWAFNEPKLCAYPFLMGIHSTNGGPYRSAFTSTSGLTMSPLVSGWSGSNVPAATESNKTCLTDADTYFLEDSTGGVTYMTTGRVREGEEGKVYAFGNTNGYGVLTVDKSRYSGSSYNAIPNFSAGWMVFGSESSGNQHKMDSFVATGGSSTVNFTSGSVDYTNGGTSQAFGPYYSTDSLPSTSTDYTVTVTFIMERSNSSPVTMTDTFGFHLIVVDKGALRTAVNNAISAAYQADDFDSTDYATFESALEAAATVLGNPTASASEITSAQSALTLAAQTLSRDGALTYKAFVTHKLPAADGFTYTYNGTTYTAEGGYITINEDPVTFPSASDVTVSANEFAGYTISGDASRSYTKRRSDIFETFFYTAETSKIYFDYVDSHIIGGLTSVETVRTVTYGQPYDTLPAPKMDGWVFGGWYETGTTNKILATTNCTMINGALNVQAKWTCIFDGGYGTSTEPFLIANKTTTAAGIPMVQLDKIDDVTAYQINDGNNGTKGKYYKQIEDITYTKNSVPLMDFGGNYDGNGKTITLPADVTISGTSAGCIFASLNGAVMSNLNVDLQGELGYIGTSGAVGFIGTMTDSIIDNIHITFNGTTMGADSGVFASTAAGSTITNCSVDVQSGTVAGDAFIGNMSGGVQANNWVKLVQAANSAKSNTANGTVRVRENVTAAMTYAGGRYTFTATPSSGWGVQFRKADDTLVANSSTYSPTTDETGKVYYVCAVKDVTFQAGAHGTLTGAGTFKMRQNEVKTDLIPTADTGYRFTSWSLDTANGTMSDSSPYSYTMSTTGGTVTANFSANQYSIAFDKGNVPGENVAVPATQTYSFEDTVTFPSSNIPTYTGWTFQGWYSQMNGKGTKYELNTPYPALTAENNATITLYAYWTQNVYTVTFVNGEATVQTMSVNDGDTITFPTLEKEGYKGLKWYDNSAFSGNGHGPNTTTLIYSDVTFYAKWTPISYSLVFVADGASNVPAAVERNYDQGDFTIPVTYVPIKIGHVFDGWTLSMDGSGQRYQVTENLPGKLTTVDGGEVKVYAQFSRASYTVTWVLGSVTLDGEPVLAQIDGEDTVSCESTVIFGDKISLPTGKITLLTKAFAGWYTTPQSPDDPTGLSGTPVIDQSTVTITENTTYYAHWGPAVYTIKYDGNHGTGSVPDGIVTYGALTYEFADNAFTRPGYSFNGWNTIPNPTADNPGSGFSAGESLLYDLTDENEDEVTLYAQWQGDTFKIVYNTGGIGGNVLATNNVKMDGASRKLATRTTATTDDGTYSFRGWAYSAADEQNLIIAYGSGADFSLTEEELAKCEYDLSKKQITLYAVWGRVNTVTWDPNGGKMPNGSADTFTTTVIRGDNYVLPAGSPSRPRYTFEGWYTAPALNTGTKITNETVLNSNADHTIYAQWKDTGNLTASYSIRYYTEGFTPGDYSAQPLVENPEGQIETLVDITETVNANIPVGFTLDTSLSVLSGVITENMGDDADPLVLKVYYKRNHYDVSFNANGGTGAIAPVDYAYGQTKALPVNTAISREGYTFLGWDTDANAMSPRYGDGTDLQMELNNVELFAIWKVNQYTLTIDFNYDNSTRTYTYNYGETIAPIETPTRTGWTFAGWDKDIPTTMPAENLTITAQWSDSFYTLTLLYGYDNLSETKQYVFDAEIETPDDPTRPGYTFNGWSPAIPKRMPAEDLTVTATWQVKQYLLTFGNGYGGAIFSENVDFGSTITPPDDPTREGYTFTGWNKEIPATMPANALTIDATWQVKQYLLTFTNGYGGDIRSENVDFNSAIIAPANPTRSGYTFAGWEPAVPSTMPAADLTITAKWEKAKFVLTFVNGFGGTLFSEEIEYESPITAPEDPTMTGYDFTGWDQDVPATMPANHLTITAQWQAKRYWLTFLGSDDIEDVISSEKVEFGSTITPPVPDKGEGWTFAGWDKQVPLTMPAENLVFIAQWVQDGYSLVFEDGFGVTLLRTALSAGDPVPTPDAPTKEGYTFTGWNQDVPATMPAENLLIEATWQVNQHVLTFAKGYNNELYFSKTVDYGTPILPEAPTDLARTGWTFAGWAPTVSNDTKMPDSNLTITATWEANQYTVLFDPGEGGTGKMDAITLTYGVPQSLPANTFTKTGFSFAGWEVAATGAPQEDLIGSVYADTAEVSNLSVVNHGMVTLTALWDNIIYKLSFDLNGGMTGLQSADDIFTIYSSVETLYEGNDYTFVTETEHRTFLGWQQKDGEGNWYGSLYAGGSGFEMPDHNVTLYAVWSANYFELDNLVQTIEVYQQLDKLPASRTKDPRYAAGGDFASLLESDGSYSWSNFDTAALLTALNNAKDGKASAYPQSEQETVDGLVNALQSALDNVTLLNVNYDLTYKCNHSKDGYYETSNRRYYPPCESGSQHSYNSVVALIDALLAASSADSLYTAESIAQLRKEIYGGAGSTGIVQEVQALGLKMPAQDLLAPYVDQIADAYHNTPEIKPADYSQIQYLMTTYLQQTKHVTFENMETYYTAKSTQSLTQYYNNIDTTYKITRQSILNEGGSVYNRLKQYIDALVPRPADYRSVYEKILRIPCGGTYSYPSGSVDDTDVWTAWTSANAGHISQAVDVEYLNTRYELNTVAILNNVLDGINWQLDIFSQSTVDDTYVRQITSAISGLVKRTYSVTFMLNDGTAGQYSSSTGYYYGDAINFPMVDPSRDSYVFMGWSSSADEFIPVTSSDTVKGDTVLYAAWERNVARLNFDLNGGIGTAPEGYEADVGVELILPQGDTYAPEGYMFLGWSEDPEATTGVTSYTLTAKVDVTLYAIWGALAVAVVPKESSKAVIDKENGVIYGLALNMTAQDLVNEYLDVEGNGTLRVQQTAAFGTGVKVELINNYTNQVDATYYIVIYGDVDGDGIITQGDFAAIKAGMNGSAPLPEGDPRRIAADLDFDGMVTQMDIAVIKGMMNGSVTFDQTSSRPV